MFSSVVLTEEIVKCGKLCGEKNFTPGYSGNISARYQEGMLITVSGSANGYLQTNDIVYTNFKGESMEEGKKPSSEKFLHIEIYKRRPDINYIIHVHAPFLSSFASAGKDLMKPIMAENVFYFGGIPLAKYALPSSMELVKNTVDTYASGGGFYASVFAADETTQCALLEELYSYSTQYYNSQS